MALADALFKWVGHGRYNAVKPTLVSGATNELQVDRAGRLLVTTLQEDTAVTLWADPVATANRGNVRTGPTTLYQVIGSNEGAAKRWIQVFDAAADPANGAIPKFSVPVEAGRSFSLELGARGRSFPTGIRWAVSTTAMPLTLDAGGVFLVNAEYSY